MKTAFRNWHVINQTKQDLFLISTSKIGMAYWSNVCMETIYCGTACLELTHYTSALTFHFGIWHRFISLLYYRYWSDITLHHMLSIEILRLGMRQCHKLTFRMTQVYTSPHHLH